MSFLIAFSFVTAIHAPQNPQPETGVLIDGETPRLMLERLERGGATVNCAGEGRSLSDVRELWMTTCEDKLDLRLLEHLPGLRTLTMRERNLDIRTWQSLSSAKQLIGLDLSGAPIDDAHLNVIIQLENLISLKLSGTEITDAGLTSLRRMSSLRQIDVSHTAITDAGMTVIQHLPKLVQLTANNTSLTGEFLPDVPLDSPLKRLSLSECGLRDDILSERAWPTRLESLDISFNPEVGNRSVDGIAYCLALRGLNVSGTGITSGAFDRLANSVALESISFAQTEIRNRDLECLLQVRTLKSVYAINSRIGLPTVIRFVKAAPNIRRFPFFEYYTRRDLECLDESVLKVLLPGGVDYLESDRTAWYEYLEAMDQEH